jgi:hypothetical protein
MEVVVQYSGPVDREAKVAENEAKGLRMSSDTFDDPLWQHGDPPVGTMIFTDKPTIAALPLPVRNLAAEIDELKVKVAALFARVP